MHDYRYALVVGGFLGLPVAVFLALALPSNLPTFAYNIIIPVLNIMAGSSLLSMVVGFYLAIRHFMTKALVAGSSLTVSRSMQILFAATMAILLTGMIMIGVYFYAIG